MQTKHDQEDTTPPSNRRGNRWRTPALTITCVAVIGAGIASGLFKPASAPAATAAESGSAPTGPRKEAPPVPATTVKVVRQSMPLLQTGVGTVATIASVTVKARVDGQLESVNFTEGQDVKAGQVLARIDPRTFQAQVAQLQAQRAKDQAQLANARVDLKRYGELIKEDATSQQTLDTQQATVNQLEAAVRSDDAQIQSAKVQLDYTTIVAPISGRVGARLVDPGNIVHATDTTGLLVINQIDPIAVQFTVPESSFQQINQALRASPQPLQVDAVARSSGDVIGTGKLALLNNQIDTTTGTVMLKGHFANAEHKLWPGQSVYGQLRVGERPDALVVPSAVVQRSQDGLFAYIVKPDQTVQVQPIEVADTQRGKTVVTKGLNEGDRVVVDGQFKLKPGVHIVESRGRGAAPGAAGDPAKDASKDGGNGGSSTTTAPADRSLADASKDSAKGDRP